VAVRSFPNVPPPTRKEQNVQMLRDLNACAQIFSDGVGMFVLIFCGLNFITYRRVRKQQEDEERD
jgi:hypothetical protein